MEQLVDNDTRQSVGPIGRQQVARVFGTRVAQTILASDDNDRINRPDIWMPAIDPLKKLLCHGGRPHMGPGLRRDDSECVAVPAFNKARVPPSHTIRDVLLPQ